MTIADAEQKLASVRHHIVLRDVHRNVLEEYAKVIRPPKDQGHAESQVWFFQLKKDAKFSRKLFRKTGCFITPTPFFTKNTEATVKRRNFKKFQFFFLQYIL